ncbi:MAG TPA: 50S ribosomal protein L10 [Solirubrobacterales bacterium]|jgi:large subunit ribosomal protein L10
MNREEKSATIHEIAAQIEGAEAIFAVDYRGISVPQAAELRDKLRETDSTFRIVKNRLTKLAAEQVGEERLAELLTGPTALTFVRGDTAAAAKAITTFNKEHDVLTYKGGLMGETVLDDAAFKSIARLPSREVLVGQFAGIVASPLTGLVRGLGSLIGGLALQLGQIAEQGLVTGENAAAAPAPAAEETSSEAPAEDTATEDVQDSESTSPEASQPDSSPEGEEAPKAEQETADPAAPGSEAEDADGTDQDSNEEEG